MEAQEPKDQWCVNVFQLQLSYILYYKPINQPMGHSLQGNLGPQGPGGHPGPSGPPGPQGSTGQPGIKGQGVSWL